MPLFNQPMDRLHLDWKRGPFDTWLRRRLIVILVALLAVVILLDGLLAFLDLPQTITRIERQITMTGEANAAAWFAGGLTILAGIAASTVAAMRRTSLTPSRRTIGVWYGAGALFTVAGALDGLGLLNDITMPFRLAGLVAIIAVAMICYRDLPVGGQARRLVLLGCLLLLINPVFEWAETGMMSNPNNYHFVASDLPHQFNADAWTHLWLVSRAQEVTEALSSICFLTAFLMYGERLLGDNAPGRARTRHLISLQPPDGSGERLP